MSQDFGRGGGFEDEGVGLPAMLRDPVGVLRRGWKWSLVGFVLLAIPAVIAAQLVPATYLASSRLALSGKAIPDEYVPTTIVAGGPEQFQAVKNRVLTRDRIGAMIVEEDFFAKERAEKTLASIVSGFRNDLDIITRAVRDEYGHERSMEITISYEGRAPGESAAIVNRVANDLIDEYVEYRSKQSQVTFDFMRREFENADQDLRDHQRTLATFRDRHRGSLPEEQEATLGKLERLESQRRSIILQINDANVQLSMRDPSAPLGPIWFLLKLSHSTLLSRNESKRSMTAHTRMIRADS